MSIAEQLEKHAAEELKHAFTISRQIDCLGAMPTVEPKTGIGHRHGHGGMECAKSGYTTSVCTGTP